MRKAEKARVLKKEQSEEKKELALRFLEYYRRGVENMQKNGIFEKIKKCHQYWKGEQRKPKSDNDPCSNINIIHPMVEGQVALLVEQNISVSAMPVTPGDIAYAEKATGILEFIKSRNSIQRVIERHERGREKYGSGILRVIYDPDKLSGAGLPVIENVPLQNICVDPCITDAEKINEAEFIIEKVVKSIYWAKENYGEEIAAQIDENYFPFGEGDVFDEEEADGDNAKYLHLLVWTIDGGELRLTEMSGCGVILSDSADTKSSFYSCGRYPYFFTPLYELEGSIFGMGDVELTAPVQDIINDLDDQIRLNARLTANPQRLVEIGSGLDLDALTNEPGLNIPVNSINSVRDLQPKEIPSYVVERRKLALQYEGQKVSRFSDQMIGAKQSGVDTATESLALQQSGSNGIAYKKSQLQDTLAKVFAYALELVREFWDEPVMMRISEDENEFVSMNPQEFIGIDRLVYKEGELIADGKKNAEFDINVSVGAGLPTNKAFQYNMMRELYQLKIISPEELRAWLCKSFGLSIAPAPAQQAPQGNVLAGAQGGGAVPINQNANIEGINANGQVMRPTAEGGVAM